MEDGKSHDLPSVGWRPSKASGVDQTESEGLRTRETNGVSHNLRAREDEMLCPSSSKQMGSKKQMLPSFVVFRPSHPHWGEQSALIPPIQKLISSRNTLRGTQNV